MWTDPPGQCWEGFVHDVDELLVPAEGVLEIEIDGDIMRPEIGQELLIPAGAVHSVRNLGGTTARWYYGYRKP
nr:cupin domain-containing protein [Microbulbifer guangxiensis]